MGELLIGEQSCWFVGVCMIRALNDDGDEVAGGMKEVPTYIELRGENGQRLRSYKIDDYDAHYIDREFRQAIKHEMNAL